MKLPSFKKSDISYWYDEEKRFIYSRWTV